MYKNTQYSFMNAKELKPGGWLKKQLRLQADGLCGNLDKVWNDIKDSAWIGGTCEGWERVPYWLDGFIPLAYLLEDDDLIARAKKYVDAIISNQNEDGWICPCSMEERPTYDLWAVLLIAKVLTVYADCSGDMKVIDVIENCLKQFNQHLRGNTLRNWGSARWFEGLVAIAWLYEKRPSDWLLALAKQLKIQGCDWKTVFTSGVLEDFPEGWDHYSHVVNIGMALKQDALWSLVTDTNTDPDAFAECVFDYLQKNHGTATGHFTGDENLSGKSPLQGTELCGVVETMYSYEWLFAVTGNTKWLDRLENLAFNALPATISPDMWSHQYLQMTNQVACFPMSKQPFRTNGREAHLFGLEPNYGCCTANFVQGWPKFALSSFMKGRDGIISAALVPSKANFTIDGVHVSCELVTDYPFRNTLTYKIKADSPVQFTLGIRIPGCAVSAQVDGKSASAGEIVELERVWDDDAVKVSLNFETRIVQRPNEMVCVWHGPILYSIPIKEKWERVEYEQNDVIRKYPYCDYYIYPLSKWNYALADDNFELNEKNFEYGFDPVNPPVTLKAKVVEIEWGFNNGHCDEVPTNREPLSKVQEVEMIPYGCTALRMTEVPLVRKNRNLDN